jgi:hypothetical protein
MLELSAHGLKILWGEDGLSTSSVITVMFLGLRPLREVMEVGIRDLGAGMKPKESSVKPEMVDWACDQVEIDSSSVGSVCRVLELLMFSLLLS